MTNLQEEKVNKIKTFNKEDWSSAYKNVEKELTKESLFLSKGQHIKGLNGTLLRNGPGMLERAGKWVHHPFDGDGMITAIKFEEGKPFLTNKFVKTKGYLEEEKNNKFIYRGVFGTQKAGGIINNALDLKLKNIANTHVVKLGDEILALWEAAGPHALDPNSLETIGLTTDGFQYIILTNLIVNFYRNLRENWSVGLTLIGTNNPNLGFTNNGSNNNDIMPLPYIGIQRKF